MKKLKANSITIYNSIKELKDSRINEPFSKEKYMKYIKKMDEFHKKLHNSNVVPQQ